MHKHLNNYIEDIAFLVLKKYFSSERSERVKYFSTLEKTFRISKRPCKVLFNINTDEIPNHFTLIVFWYERRDLLCSHSKGDIFTCEDITFSRESSPGISLVTVYIIK